MFLPLYDRNPLKIVPYQRVTVSLIVLNVLVYCWQVTLSTPAINSFVLGYGMVPAVLFEQVNLPPEVIRVPAEVSLFTSLFLHADFWHLLGNMLFLWVFGDNIEDAMGHLRFAIFYILCGLLAGVAHAVAEPDSLAPLIGASGAVAGILGAYIILHPRVKVLVLVFSRIPVFLPARWLLFGWILFQFVAALNVSEEAVAWWAHIGGFAVGMALIPIFRHRDVPLFDKGTPHQQAVVVFGARKGMMRVPRLASAGSSMTAPRSDSFSNLPLAPEQLKNLQDLGFAEMTPIQARALPEVLAGRDILAQAKTGSGKTAAFGLGILHHIDTASKEVQALVVCPTRELAEQVSKELRRLAQAMANVKVVSICGGKPFGPQKATLAYGTHIVVGTPGRLLDHLQKRSLNIGQIKTLVLDEADRMLDMGFAGDVQTIISFAPGKRQTLLFSATYPDEIRRMSATVQHKPMDIKIEDQHQSDVIQQLFYEVKKHERNAGLLALFEHYKLSSALVFCHTKRDCDEVAEFLNQHRIAALAIHGDLEQRDRDRVLVQFANHSTSVLVATDVAARGLDIKSLPTVINYELPHDPEIYTHRIGRTGRAGEVGQAFSLFTNAEQVRLNAIEAHQGEPCVCDVLESLDRDPDFTLRAPMVTIEINVGRKQKIRPGDILGSLTGDGGLAGAQIGKIDIFDHHCYVAIEASSFRRALGFLSDGKVKGRSVRARRVR